jgi:hypothetical protein
MYVGRVILKSFSPKNSIYAEFMTGLVSVTLVKLIILFMIPRQSILLSVIIVGLISIFIYSLGLGIMLEQYYLKNSRTGNQTSKPEAINEETGTDGMKPVKNEEQSGQGSQEPGTEGVKPA